MAGDVRRNGGGGKLGRDGSGDEDVDRKGRVVSEEELGELCHGCLVGKQRCWVNNYGFRHC